MASPSIISSGSVSTLSLGKPVQSWSGSYVEFSEQLPSLSPDRSHNEAEGTVGSSRALRPVLAQIRTVAPT